MAWVENLNILSTGWFIFFLLIFLIGYIFVEIILWKDYFFRKNLEKYDNHLFDRLIHYIAWWIVLNVLYVILLHFVDWYKNLTDIFNNSWKLWWTLWFLWEVKDLQFIFFSIQYFFVVIVVLFILTEFCLFIYRIIVNFDSIIEFSVLVFDFLKKRIKRKK